MSIHPLKSNNNQKSLSFSGLKTPNVDDLTAVKRFVNCGSNGLEQKLVEKVEKSAPDVLENINGLKYVKNFSPIKNFIDGAKSFTSMPLDFLNFISKKFPNSKLYNSNLLAKHRNSSLLQDEVKALQGIEENGLRFLKELAPDGKYPAGGCDNFCHSICDPMTKKFNQLLNKTMESCNSTYDTKKERFVARIVSGFTAAWFLGKDFFNKSILKGKSTEEAKKEQHLKQGQEVKENICEGITQFAVFACFSKFVNANVWASAVIGTLIGFASRIISRVSSGMPLKRIDVPEQREKLCLHVPSVQEFMDSVKNKKQINLFEYKEKISDEKNKKKPILSLQNILIFCVASIAGGFGLRYLKNHTQLGKNIAQYFAERAEKFNKSMVEDVWGDQATLKKLRDTLQSTGEDSLYNDVVKLVKSCNGDIKQVFLGTRYKTTKLFGKFDVKTKDLHRLKTAPFRMIKEFVSYPFKIADKLVSAIKNSRLKAQGIKIPEKTDKYIKDVYDIKNIYLCFKEFENRFGADPEKLTKEFGEHIYKMRLASNNNITSSKNNNSKIAVLAQTLGTLTGMGFSMNDEYNATVRNGGTKAEAQKDARKRGVNKFARMSEQVIISGSLNDIFAKQYNGSIFGAAAIVFVSTILTDIMSRITSGMPFKKITNKEEYEKHEQEHKDGLVAKYNKAIDKLTE